MKIYASRTNSSNEQILDNCIGKDIWIRIKELGTGFWWVRILRKRDINGEIVYYCNGGTINGPSRYFRTSNNSLPFAEYEFYLSDIEIPRPVDMISTSDLFIESGE